MAPTKRRMGNFGWAFGVRFWAVSGPFGLIRPVAAPYQPWQLTTHFHGSVPCNLEGAHRSGPVEIEVRIVFIGLGGIEDELPVRPPQGHLDLPEYREHHRDEEDQSDEKQGSSFEG